MSGRAFDRMHQTRLGIHADVRFHPEVPPVAFFARVHFRVARFVLVLRSAGRRDQGRIHCSPHLEQQALANEQIVDGCQDLFGQLVLF